MAVRLHLPKSSGTTRGRGGVVAVGCAEALEDRVAVVAALEVTAVAETVGVEVGVVVGVVVRVVVGLGVGAVWAV